MRIPSLLTRLALVTGIVVAGALAPATALADGPLALRMQVGGKCVAGHKPTDDPITVKLLRPDGSTRATRTDPTSEFAWRVCFNVPVAGSRVRLSTSFAPVRTVRIPRLLTAAANRVTNVVNGRAPAGGKLSITYHSCHPGACVPWPSRSATVDSEGRYRKDLSTGSSPADIDGSDRIDVSYLNGQDSFTRTTYATYMETSTPNKIRISCQRKGTTAVKLRSSGGTLRATKSFTATKDCATASGSFKKNGEAVNVGIGDRITAGFASDASLEWPDMAIKALAGTSDFVGHCLPNANYLVYVTASPLPGYIGTTDANGNLSGTLLATFGSGDEVHLVCESSRGDRVRRTRVLP